jgi:hypothetical protein
MIEIIDALRVADEPKRQERQQGHRREERIDPVEFPIERSRWLPLDWLRSTGRTVGFDRGGSVAGSFMQHCSHDGGNAEGARPFSAVRGIEAPRKGEFLARNG